jgi:hypothetical protein
VHILYVTSPRLYTHTHTHMNTETDRLWLSFWSISSLYLHTIYYTGEILASTILVFCLCYEMRYIYIYIYIYIQRCNPLIHCSSALLSHRILFQGLGFWCSSETLWGEWRFNGNLEYFFGLANSGTPETAVNRS